MAISAGSSAWSITSACKPLEAALIGCAGDETRDASDHAGHTFIEGLAHFDAVTGLQCRNACRRAGEDEIAGFQFEQFGQKPDLVRDVPDHLGEVTGLRLLDLDLQTPRLHLLPDQNRLRAEMAVAAAGPALNRVHQGSFDVDFALRYEPSDRTLRAHQLRLARLTFPTLPARATEMINLYAPTLADQSLREVVVHELTAQDLRAVDAMGMQPGAITVTSTGLVVGLVLKPL